jgi:hypothetical protein
MAYVKETGFSFTERPPAARQAYLTHAVEITGSKEPKTSFIGYLSTSSNHT